MYVNGFICCVGIVECCGVCIEFGGVCVNVYVCELLIGVLLVCCNWFMYVLFFG